VATAGDVNGDGFSDVIVGAWKHDNGETNEGRASLYLGSAGGLGTSPVWTAEGNEANALFGSCVATAGDVNGDGYSDVLVGAEGFAATASNKGRALLFLGSASGLSSSPAWTVDGGPGAMLGHSVATAGDVNGDGYDDVIVGAWLSSNGQSQEGQAFVYHGSATGLSATPAWTGEIDQAGAFFGHSVSTAGDVNADGYADVVVGAWGYDNGWSNEGGAFLYLGSPTGLAASPSWIGEGDQAEANYGFSVSTAGDVNGDGFGDLVVGAPGHDNGQDGEGRASVYLGSPAGLATAPVATREPDQAQARFGLSVATAGDVNGDGHADVIIGAETYDAGQTNEGRAFVYHGRALGLVATPAWTGESGQGGALFGASVATAGDVNGDGYSDIVAGAYQYDNGEADEGRAFVYHGGSGGLSLGLTWYQQSTEDDVLFGYSASTAGDVNGDGYADVVIGAPRYGSGESREGRAFLFLGSAAGVEDVAAWFAEGNQPDAALGSSVATAGDVNGDGYSDVVVGAPGIDSLEGRAFVHHGSPAGLAGMPAWSAKGEQDSVSFGTSVASAGDVNGDGFSDVIVGAPAVSDSPGRAYVYLGTASGLGFFPAWMVEGDQPGAAFGTSVASAGDVNGDGFSDVIVGAPEHDGGEVNEGRALLYLGSASGLATTPAWSAEGDQADARFGRCVASAGDVNGDGYTDVIVGAWGYPNTLLVYGRAFVYHGSAAGLASTPAWVGEEPFGARYGWSVAGAGDVNGDGYSDVIVAASGSAIAYHGSPEGLTSSAWSVTGGTFIGCVGTAGDINADGFSDVIVADESHGGGRVDFHCGNERPGLDRLAQQRRSDDSAPIPTGGVSDSETAFLLRAKARTASGRGKVRLQYEVKPWGAPFDGSGVVTGNAVDTGAPGGAVPVFAPVNGLSPHTRYRWRIRFVADSPFFPGAPWFHHAGNGAAEADLRTLSALTATPEAPKGRSMLRLAPCTPNPFTHATRLSYVIPARARVRLAIHDVGGRRVATLVDEVHEAGGYARQWDGRGGGHRLPSGLYFARLEVEDRVETRKVVLTR